MAGEGKGSCQSSSSGLGFGEAMMTVPGSGLDWMLVSRGRFSCGKERRGEEAVPGCRSATVMKRGSGAIGRAAGT